MAEITGSLTFTEWIQAQSPENSGQNIQNVTVRISYKHTYEKGKSTSTFQITDMEVRGAAYYDFLYMVKGSVTVNGIAVYTFYNEWLPFYTSLSFQSVGVSFSPVTLQHNSNGVATATVSFAPLSGYGRFWFTQFDSVGNTYDGGSAGYNGSGKNATLGSTAITKYTITFNKNNKTWDSFPSSSMTKEENTSGTLPTPTRDKTYGTTSNFTITGNSNGGGANTSIIATKKPYTTYSGSWNKKADGSGTKYNFGETITFTSSFTLYSQQTSSSGADYSNNQVKQLPIPTAPKQVVNNYNVKFIMNSNSLIDENLNVTEIITYDFYRWTKDKAGTQSVSYLTSEDTVYAQWNENIDNEPITLPSISRPGHIFKGWSTSQSGTSLLPAGTKITITNDIVYYAIWEANGTVRIYIDGEYKLALPYIYDGTSWKIVLPYLYDGTNWKICSG